MKNKKLLGALIAFGGSALAIGSAYALYQGVSQPAAKDVVISTKVTGDVVLHAGVESQDSEHRVLTPSSRTRDIDLSAGFTTSNDSVYAQEYYLAKLTFKVSSDSAEFIDGIKDQSWVKLGVQEDEQHENEYGSYWKDKSLNGDNKVIEDEGKTIVWAAHYPLFKGADISRFELHLILKNTITDSEYKAMAESTYTVDFAVSTPDSDYDMAHIRGPITGSNWDINPDYVMAPNAKADIYQWMYKTSNVAGAPNKLSHGAEFKLANGNQWCHGEGANHTWDSANDGKTIMWSSGSEWYFLEG